MIVDAGTEFKKDFLAACEAMGISLRVVPTETPWQHGSIEVFWHTLRRCLRLTWRDLATQPGVTVQEALTLAVNARNDLGRLSIGVSPAQLVLNRQPRRLQGDDLDEDVDARMYSDKTFADERARRAIAEKAWIQARTWLQMTRMATTHAMRPRDLTVGELVLI